MWTSFIEKMYLAHDTTAILTLHRRRNRIRISLSTTRVLLRNKHVNICPYSGDCTLRQTKSGWNDSGDCTVRQPADACTLALGVLLGRDRADRHRPRLSCRLLRGPVGRAGGEVVPNVQGLPLVEPLISPGENDSLDLALVSPLQPAPPPSDAMTFFSIKVFLLIVVSLVYQLYHKPIKFCKMRGPRIDYVSHAAENKTLMANAG